MQALKNIEHTAFISYAQADDVAWFDCNGHRTRAGDNATH